MNLAKFAVTRPVAVTMRIASLVVLGFICLLRLPIDLLPRIDIPIVAVSVNWPNTSPEEMETQITRPIEQAVGSLRGLNMVSSSSSQGSTFVRVQLNYGVDVDAASIDVMQMVQRAVGSFPNDPTISPPRIFKFDPSTLPILMYGIQGPDEDLIKLRSKMINEISPQIEAADGVAAVNISGGEDRAIMVEVDPEKLKSRNLSIAQLSAKISAENISLPAGSAIQGKTQYTIRSVGYFKSLDELRMMPIGSYNGNLVRLQEVANVRDASQDILSYTRVNGKPALVMTVTKQNDANTVETSKNVEKVLADIEHRDPSLHFAKAYDQAKFISDSVDDLFHTAVIGAILAILIITFFLRNLKSTFVVALSIPISIISTFTLLYFCGFTLNTISLSGLALASGLIVDDAIVVLENIYRHIEKAKQGRVDAAISGTQEILSAVFASTFTIMIVFLPLLLIKGQSGQIFTQFALVIIFSLAVSLLDATSIVPMLTSRMVSEEEVLEEADPENHPHKKVTPVTRFMDWAGTVLHRLDSAYRRGLEWTLSRRGTVLLIGGLSVIGALLIWPMVGKENFPKSDSGNLNVRLRLPIGTPVNVTDGLVKQMEAIILDDKDVDVVIAGAGANVGLRGAGGGGPNNGSATVQLKLNRKSSTEEVIKRLQGKLAVLPGVRAQVSPLDVVQNILGNNTGFGVDVYGQDLPSLTAAAKMVEETLSKVPGLQNVDVSVDDTLPEIEMSVNREKASTLGVSFNDVASVISSSTSGKLSSYYQEKGFQYPIYVQVPEDKRQTIEQLENLPVTTQNGTTIILGQVANAAYGMGPTQISRQNRQRVISVGGNVQDRSDSDVQADALAALAKLKMPEGTYYTLGVRQLQQGQEYSGLGLAVVLAVALIYMLLAAQFESFLYPLVVLFSVPLCAIGFVLALFLTDRAFGLTAFIGLLMLVGISVKNGILLVDYTNQLRARGIDRHDALLTAGPTRLRPILMTSLCAILGMAPLALGIGTGSELYVPLATAVMGGLATSTILTLFVIPAVYTIFDDIKAKYYARKEAK
ncbi:MAG: efflux RND transporter permease subunit [Armatimonadetes bacterium]|nr:efflux RND transporter permease subunit [Armatimonadota bacterium]